MIGTPPLYPVRINVSFQHIAIVFICCDNNILVFEWDLVQIKSEYSLET